MLSEFLAPALNLNISTLLKSFSTSLHPTPLTYLIIASGQTLSLSDSARGSLITGFMDYGIHTYFPIEMQVKQVWHYSSL